MKKVLAIAPYPYLPFFSGGQKFIAQFFEHLGTAIDLTVISVAENDFSLAKSYKTIPLLKKSFSRYVDRSLISKIVTLTKQESFDTIICEHPYFAWLAFAVRKQTGVKVIIHTHNIEYQRFRSTGKWWWPVLKQYEKSSFEKADGLFFISSEDRDFAIQEWKIPSEKCIDLPFGVEIKSSPEDRSTAKQFIAQKHGISIDEKILLFNGLLNYKPNIDAVRTILDKINPLLLAQSSFNYKIIICGKGLPEKMNLLKDYADKNIMFAGFAESIEPYIKAADIFLNPVQSGGGVKTKVVEAIAYGTTVISTATGAAGIVKKVCGAKLVTVADNDWEEFAKEVIINAASSIPTPQEYYNYYFYGNIIQRLIGES
ncbi:MAG: glycosyltransferase family 4 protein [Chitinophagaceae bacterium]|nr:glycosyltransferase family 4 protein [Chitinophagaceae bacterium]